MVQEASFKICSYQPLKWERNRMNSVYLAAIISVSGNLPWPGTNMFNKLMMLSRKSNITEKWLKMAS